MLQREIGDMIDGKIEVHVAIKEADSKASREALMKKKVSDGNGFSMMMKR